MDENLLSHQDIHNLLHNARELNLDLLNSGIFLRL
jgi:hypothetical protein